MLWLVSVSCPCFPPLSRGEEEAAVVSWRDYAHFGNVTRHQRFIFFLSKSAQSPGGDRSDHRPQHCLVSSLSPPVDCTNLHPVMLYQHTQSYSLLRYQHASNDRAMLPSRGIVVRGRTHGARNMKYAAFPGSEVARLPFIVEASILVIPLAPVVSVLYQTAARENENVDCAAKTASPHGHGKIL